LAHKDSIRSRDNGLVSKSASWSWVCIWLTLRVPFWTWSRTKRRSICICFILEWWTKLKLRWVTPRLSHTREGDTFNGNPSLWRSVSSHMVSDALFARVRYSAFVVDQTTTLCFFEFHETRLQPRNAM
jgi:hypothetical protein